MTFRQTERDHWAFDPRPALIWRESSRLGIIWSFACTIARRGHWLVVVRRWSLCGLSAEVRRYAVSHRELSGQESSDTGHRSDGHLLSSPLRVLADRKAICCHRLSSTRSQSGNLRVLSRGQRKGDSQPTGKFRSHLVCGFIVSGPSKTQFWPLSIMWRVVS